MTQQLFDYDKSLGYKLVCGIDEAGRGPLAGPVVTASVIMPLDHMIDKINDSKKVSEKKREQLYEMIIKEAISYSVSIIDNHRIDEINILNATKEGMTNCIKNLEIKPDIVLIDAVKLDLDYNIMSIIKGDATSYNIAAASIIAKVTRDRLMREYDKKYPGYGFAQHKGYGTKAHIEALKKYGKVEIHRDSFIKNFV